MSTFLQCIECMTSPTTMPYSTQTRVEALCALSDVTGPLLAAQPNQPAKHPDGAARAHISEVKAHSSSNSPRCWRARSRCWCARIPTCWSLTGRARPAYHHLDRCTRSYTNVGTHHLTSHQTHIWHRDSLCASCPVMSKRTHTS